MIEWNQVTWYSKLGAIIFFLGVVPALCFYIGTQYELTQTTLLQPLSSNLFTQKITPGQPATTASTVEGDCEKISQQQPRNSCLSDKSQALDVQMNKILASLLGYASTIDNSMGYGKGLGTLDVSQKGAIEASQKSFIAYRNVECTSEADSFSGGSLQPEIDSVCYLQLTNQRIKDLTDLSHLLGPGPTQ